MSRDEKIVLAIGLPLLIAIASLAGYYHVLDDISLDTIILMTGSMP